jgi:hypothetical protein
MPRVHEAIFYTTDDDPPVVHPALIAAVHNEITVDVYVFLPLESGPRREYRVPYGWGPRTWCYHPLIERDKKSP